MATVALRKTSSASGDKPTSLFEFWPTWVMYGPVALQWLWLSLRHRSLTLPLLTNPNLPLAGMVGESRHALMNQARGECHQTIYPWVYHQRDAAIQWNWLGSASPEQRRAVSHGLSSTNSTSVVGAPKMPGPDRLRTFYEALNKADWNGGALKRLVFSASHCRGAVFEDARTDITPQLTACIHQIMSDLPDFYYGRSCEVFRHRRPA